MGHDPLCPAVKFHWLPQQDSLCNIRSFKLSQLFDSHWKMKSMHRSEKLLNLIHPGLLPKTWIWKIIFSLEFVFHFVFFPFKSTATIKDSDLFSPVYKNKPLIMLNLSIFDHDHVISLGIFFWVMWSLIVFDYLLKMFTNRINRAFNAKKKKKKVQKGYYSVDFIAIGVFEWQVKLSYPLNDRIISTDIKYFLKYIATEEKMSKSIRHPSYELLNAISLPANRWQAAIVDGRSL